MNSQLEPLRVSAAKSRISIAYEVVREKSQHDSRQRPAARCTALAVLLGPFGMPAYLAPQQLELIESCEPSAYHDDGRVGYFAMLVGEGSRKLQRCYPLESMHLVIQGVDLTRDSWISQAEFYRRTRRVVHLKRVGVCFADLDTYKVPGLVNLRPDSLLKTLLAKCRDDGIPEPSLVVFSGRGLQVKWVLDVPLPSEALTRWNCVQRELTRRLTSLGSDTASIDVARVLRLVHSRNSKSGQIVRILHQSPARLGFDALADSVLPFKRGRFLESRDAGGAPLQAVLRARMRPASHRLAVGVEAANDPRLGFTGAQLAWDRLADIRRLAALRGWTRGAPDNWRDCAVFIGACLLAQSVPNIQRLDLEVRVLAREFAPGWSQARVADAVSAVLARADAARAGERIEWRGRAVNPRYRFRNDTLIDRLEVTEDEQRQLKCLVGSAEAQRRDTERARRVRREAGALEREEYLQRSAVRLVEALRLREQGASWGDVASAFGFASAASARVSVSKKRKDSV